MEDKSITIYSDSRSAIQTVSSNIIKLKLVKLCRNNLSTLGDRNRVPLCWGSGYCNLDGNKAADALSREGASMAANPAEYTYSG